MICRLCWVCFVSLHAFCVAYFTLAAWCYWQLPKTALNGWLSMYDLGSDSTRANVVAFSHGCLALIHFGYFLSMVVWSIKKQHLIFVTPSKPDSSKSSDNQLSERIASISNASKSIGVESPYFDWVLLVREIIETALQTQQAYRISLWIPRPQLNRTYTLLLIINCWSTSLIHLVYHKNSVRRRLFAIVCDCALDLVSSVGITTVLLAIYSQDFDFTLNQFPMTQWYEDVWVVHAMSEFQILLVTSWGDLVMRIIFALSMIGNMNNMKKLLITTSTTRKLTHQLTVVQPLYPSSKDIAAVRRRRAIKTILTKETRWTQAIFFLWGAIVLVLHLSAESVSEAPQCLMQVKPWGRSQPSCSLLLVDCYSSKTHGSAQELVDVWSSFDISTTVRLVIRHCDDLEMPSMLSKFSRIKALKLYNSTISSWNESASISQENHPHLFMLFLVRVNFTNGELPPGLSADDFPQSLLDIEFCVTNLRTLPDDLDRKWPQLASVYFEASNLTEVPLSLARLAPQDLSLALNPISHIPAALFEGDGAYLHVGGTLISELPQNVENLSPNLAIRLENTNISFFWDWIDPLIANAGLEPSAVPTLLATGTPYCKELQQLYDGQITRFSEPWHESQSSILLNASSTNWATLKKAVSCDQWPSTWYPLEKEDAYSKAG